MRTKNLKYNLFKIIDLIAVNVLGIAQGENRSSYCRFW